MKVCTNNNFPTPPHFMVQPLKKNPVLSCLSSLYCVKFALHAALKSFIQFEKFCFILTEINQAKVQP